MREEGPVRDIDDPTSDNQTHGARTEPIWLPGGQMRPDREDPSDLSAVLCSTLRQWIETDSEPVDLDASLASLGLDSLSTLRWRQELSTRFGIELPLVSLTGGITVREVLAELSTGEATASGEAADAGEAAPPEPTGLTVVQEAYWTGRGDDFGGGGVATFWYHEYERDGRHRGGRDLEADLDRLEVAWKRVVALHPMLRTIIDRDARPVLAVHDLRDWTIPRHDLRALEPSEADRRAEQLRHELSHQLRPTGVWPIIDVQAVLLPGDILRLCLGFDALLVDFASWGLIMRQWGQFARRPRMQIAAAAHDFAEALAVRADDAARRRRRSRDRAWWREQEIPPAPLAGASFPQSRTRFRRHRELLDADVWARISAGARARGLSPTTVVLTAFALACDRWAPSGAEGLTLNLTTFDRPPGFDEVVGDFSSTTLLPLGDGAGFRPSGSDSFATLAEAVNRRFWEALDHGAYGGVEVARDRPGEGPWPVVFTSGLGQTSGMDDRWLGDRVFGVSQTPQVLWDHLVWEEDGVLLLTHDVVEDALDQALVEGIAGMQRALLDSLVDDTGWDRPAPAWDPLAQPPVPAARQPGCGPLLHDPWLASHPEHRTRPALLGTDVHLRHEELARAAEDVAASLRAQGVEPGDLVLIALPKGVEQIVAVLGTMLTGAGYVPADPAWPTARVEAIRDRTGLSLAIAAADVELPAGVRRLPPIPVADGRETPAAPGPGAPATGKEVVRCAAAGDGVAEAAPGDLAYVIFTSGSTGQPKGVAIEHAQARTTIDEVNHRFGITSADRVFAISALSFDLSVYDVFGVLGVGGGLVLPDPDRLRDPQHWLEAMAEHTVTVWNSAPPLMEMLIEYAESVPEQARAALGGLRHCLLSGDWIPVTLPDRLRALAPDVAVHSLGGATEASIWSITHPIGKVDPDWPSIPYGRALPGQSFSILDEDGRPVRVGEPGELHIGGGGVARGYIGAPELSAERFLEREDLGTRLYRTGDLGRWRRDGSIEFLGRTDRQVKIGGHRIELGEVETALLRLPRIRQALAGSVPGPDGRPRLVAYISDRARSWHGLPAGEQRAVSTELAEALAARVPQSMVPSRFVYLEELPMTENGKVDHKSLPNPFARRPRQVRDSGSEHPAEVGGREPVGAEEREDGGLRVAVAELLGEGVSFDVSLVRNGVTSVQSVRLANLVEDHGLPRPAMRSLLADTSLDSLLREWEEARTPATSGPGTEPQVVAPELAAPVAPRVPPHVAVEGTPAAPVSTGEKLSLSGLAARLRRAAEMLEEVSAELTDLRPHLGGALLDEETIGVDPGVHRAAESVGAEEGSGAEDSTAFDLTEMQLAYLLGRAPDEHGRELAPHFYTEALVENLDLERLRWAWGRVVGMHPMLRAVLTPDTRQRVVEGPAVGVEFEDLRGLSPEDQQRTRENLRMRRSARQIPTHTAPMIGLHVARLDDRFSRLTLDLDLLFCDAASAVTVVEDLAALLSGREPEPAPAAFEVWARGLRAAGHRARAHWERALADLPDPLLPSIRAEGLPPRFVRRRFELGPEEWAALRRTAAAHDVTAACMLLECLGAVLAPERAGTVMLTVSRRPAAHHGVVGDYTATVPVALGDLEEGDCLRARQERLADALDHALAEDGIHGNEVLRMLRAAGRSSSVPIAVSFALDRMTTDPSQLLDVLGRTEYAISQTPHVLVDVQMFDVGGRLVCNVDADESLVSPDWTDALAEGFARELRVRSGRGAASVGSPPAGSPAAGARLSGPPEPGTGPSGEPGLSRARKDVEEIFTELLGVDRLDRHTSWFDQGASSVTLVSGQRRLQERGHAIDIIDLFARPTPADTIAHLAASDPEALPAALEPAPVTIEPAAVTIEPPLSALEAARLRGRRRRTAR